MFVSIYQIKMSMLKADVPIVVAREDNLDDMTAMFPDYDKWQAQLETFVATLGKTYLNSNYTYTNDLRTKEHQEFSSDKNVLLERIKDSPTWYEVLRSACIPYYDWEFEYPTMKDQKKSWSRDLSEAIAAIRELFPDGRIIAFDASGKAKENVFKQSFHFLVRGVGFYEAGHYVPQCKGRGFDNGVYKREGMRQLYRMPYCSKDGKTRFLKRIDLEGGNQILQSIDEALKSMEENFDDWLVSNISGENLVVVADEVSVAKKNEIVLKMDKDGEMSYDKLRDLVMCIEDSDSKQSLPRCDWIKVVWAIAYVGHKHSIVEYEKIALEFSKKADTFSGKYLPKVLAKAWSDAPRKPCDMGTLIWFAKKVGGPVKLAKWFAKYPNTGTINIRDPYVWLDFMLEMTAHKYSSKDDMMKALKANTPRVLAKVSQGSGLFIKKDDLQSMLYKEISGITKIIDFTMSFDEEQPVKKAKAKKKTEEADDETETKPATETVEKKVKFSAVVDSVVPTYGTVECDFDGKNKAVFNLWQGFQAEKLAFVDDDKLEMWDDFMLSIICNGDDTRYNYLLDLLAYCVQYPGLPPGKALALFGEQGAGKNTLVEFLTEFVFGPAITSIKAGIESVSDKFNAFLLGKKMIVVNELASTKEHFVSNFEIMKTRITESRIDVQKKGIDSYNVKSALFWVLMTNHRDALILEDKDRRYACYDVSSVKCGNVAYFDKLRETCFNQDVANHFYTRLMCRATSKAHLAKIPETQIRKELIELSRPNWMKFLHELKEKYAEQQANPLDDDNGELILKEIKAADLHKMYSEWCSTNKERSTMTMTKFGISCKGVLASKRVKAGVVYDVSSLA